MPLLDLIFQKTKVKIDSISLDASLSEEHSAEVELTDHPVEAGADITDHKRIKPRQVRITGVISNTPIELFGLGGSGDRAELAWSDLKDLQIGDKLITVVTTLETYHNMQIVDLKAPRDAAHGNALEVTMTLREVITAESETIAAPGALQKLGRKVPNPASAAARVSLLAKLGTLLGL